MTTWSVFWTNFGPILTAFSVVLGACGVILGMWLNYKQKTQEMKLTHIDKKADVVVDAVHSILQQNENSSDIQNQINQLKKMIDEKRTNPS